MIIRHHKIRIVALVATASVFFANAVITHGFSPSLSSSIATPLLLKSTVMTPHSLMPLPPIISSRPSFLKSSLNDENENNDNEEGRRAKNNEAELLKRKAAQYRKEAEKLQLSLGLQKIDALESEIRQFMEKDHPTANGKKKLDEWRQKVEDLVRGTVRNKDDAEGILAGLSSFSARKDTSSSALPPSASTSMQQTSTLEKDILKKEILELEKRLATGDIDQADAKKQLDALNKKVDSLMALASEKLPALSEGEIKSAIAFINSLSMPVRDTLARAAGYDDGYESISNMEEFVANLYRNKDTSMSTLRRLYGGAYSKNLFGGFEIETVETIDSDDDYTVVSLNELIEIATENKSMAMELFPRNFQDAEEDVLPTEADAQTVFQVLDQNTFMASERPLKVNGGYLIRGINKRKSASELLDVVEGKIIKVNPSWKEKFQLNFVEITTDTPTELTELALLITPNSFPPTAPALLNILTTTISIFFSFVYCINTFAGNEVVMQKLKEASEMASVGSYDITWFNSLLVPLLVTLGASQGAHELAHLLVAWANQIKLTPPTILPSQALPYLSFQNRIKTSPKDYNTLFDLAFVGPIAGLTASFLALLYGLQLTTTADSTTAQLLPSLSVDFATRSALGSTLIDLILGGGDGILLQQDGATQIPLHPIAVAGFLGLIINALDLIPIGSTDGGRMSQAIFGRVWHLTFSSLVFLVLFISSFVSDSQGILLGYLFIYSFTQRDMEIPCRNEIDKVELPRAIAALVSWLVAVLILVPLR
mmetsp:Transcript_25827/g.51735  ORF Transcript_25827/g.51735 Transcript_25827/m.51735 type:complete len:769 (-) Transcript_25827:153-2459(-)